MERTDARAMARMRLERSWESAERPGLVLEQFLEPGLFRDLETWSLRGLPCLADDTYADRLAHSDPPYAVWGLRS